MGRPAGVQGVKWDHAKYTGLLYAVIKQNVQFDVSQAAEFLEISESALKGHLQKLRAQVKTMERAEGAGSTNATSPTKTPRKRKAEEQGGKAPKSPKIKRKTEDVDSAEEDWAEGTSMAVVITH
jgi:hypothetical protein